MESIKPNRYYHIASKGINKQEICFCDEDYSRFMKIAGIFLPPVAEIFAYALLDNHFHFLLRIKSKKEIGYLNPKYAKSRDMALKWRTFFPKTEKERLQGRFSQKPDPEKMIQHCFSSYVKGINTKHKRSGALLEHTFRRVRVDKKHDFKRLILYVHQNPVKHGYCSQPFEYPWSSFLGIISKAPTRLFREKVIGWFGSKAGFISSHSNHDDFLDIFDLWLED